MSDIDEIMAGNAIASEYRQNNSDLLRADLAAARAENVRLREANDTLLAAAEQLIGDFTVDDKLKYAAPWVSDEWAYKDVTKLRDAVAAYRAALAAAPAA